jgi:hypothetical protein
MELKPNQLIECERYPDVHFRAGCVSDVPGYLDQAAVFIRAPGMRCQFSSPTLDQALNVEEAAVLP